MSIQFNDTKQTERLEKFPNSGRNPPELKKSRYKENIVRPCRIIYGIDGDKSS